MVSRSEVKVPHTIERLGKEARYRQIVSTLSSIFAGSGLVNPAGDITNYDLGRISVAFNQISPVRGEGQSARQEDNMREYKLQDPSTFDNWEDVGGPQEHMDLVMRGADVLTHLIQSRLKPQEKAASQWEEESIHKIRGINPYHAAAAGGLHDVGRFITHTFFQTT